MCIVWSGLGRALVGATWSFYGCYFRACRACSVIKGVFRACPNVSRPHALQKGACCTTLPTAKTTRIKLTRPSPRLVYHCNDAISRIQEGPRPQARSLSARNGEDSSDRPRRPRLSVSALRRGVLKRFSLDQSHVRIVLLVYPCVSSNTIGWRWPPLP